MNFNANMADALEKLIDAIDPEHPFDEFTGRILVRRLRERDHMETEDLL